MQLNALRLSAVVRLGKGRMKVSLMYGDGFAGREYYLRVGTAIYPILGPCGGSREDEIAAMTEARKVLSEKHPDIPESALPDSAEWDGSL